MISRMGVAVLVVVGGVIAPQAGQAQDRTTSDPVSGHGLTEEEIVSHDVLARVELLRETLETIRFEMGARRPRSRALSVTDASPREVMFQAYTLYLKAQQLGLEVTRIREPDVLLPQIPEILSLHVWRVVDLAYDRTMAVANALGIEEIPTERVQDWGTTPNDVFRAVVEVNRQFDVLIQQNLSPSDVFHQVRKSSHYAARLLGQFSGATVMPPAPRFEHGKRPVDVYNRLVECYARLRSVTSRSGHDTLGMDLEPIRSSLDDVTQVEPTEVYNVAILLVSELAHLHQALDYDDVPTPPLDFGFKLAADVYQHAGLLLAQLTELERRVKADPAWLEHRSSQ